MWFFKYHSFSGLKGYLVGFRNTKPALFLRKQNKFTRFMKRTKMYAHNNQKLFISIICPFFNKTQIEKKENLSLCAPYFIKKQNLTPKLCVDV